MKPLLVGFGDSWTFGSELDLPREQPWVVHLADKLNADHINMGTPASSIGHLVVQLFDFIKQNHADRKIIFAVGLSGVTRYLSYSNRLAEFINITPEANYRTGDIHFSGRPPEVVQEFASLANEMYRLVECEQYNQFVVTQTLFLFEQYCKNNNIDLIAFSYFDYLKPNLVTAPVYPVSITRALTGKEYQDQNIRDNEYFAGKLFHPNVVGHKQIAELLKEFYDKSYPGN